jgi:hypothetical protein
MLNHVTTFFFFLHLHLRAAAMVIPTRVYVGGLPTDVRERDIEDLFYKVCVCVCVSARVPFLSLCCSLVLYAHS